MQRHVNRMIWSFVAAGVGLSASACGVNPDRMAAIEERKARLAAQEMAENDKPLEVDESDPAAIKGAIESFNTLREQVDQKEYTAYLEGRYALQSSLQFAATEEVATHPKTPIILDRIKALDARVASVAGERAKRLVAADSRTQAASQDALFAISQGLQDCDKAVGDENATTANDTFAAYDAAIKKAAGIDSQSMTYVGPQPNGSGFLDVPAEVAVCEARMAMKRIDAADAPSKEEVSVEDYQGCGMYAVDIEARQNAPNTFGEYTITSAIALEADPGKAEPYECDQMPPVSDAPSAVQRTVKSGVSWVVPTDIISMAGPFEYEQRDELYKKGIVRIYRKQAELQTNECGSKDARVTCEAAGNPLATSFNYTTHYLLRADFHRKAANPDRCIEMASRAADIASNAPMSAPESETIYSVGADELTHDQITEQLKALATQAKDITESDWCQKKP